MKEIVGKKLRHLLKAGRLADTWFSTHLTHVAPWSWCNLTAPHCEPSAPTRSGASSQNI